MHNTQRSATLLRVVALVLLLGAAVVLAIALYTLVFRPSGATSPGAAVVVTAAGQAFSLIGLAAVLWGVASVLSRPRDEAVAAPALEELNATLGQLRAAVAGLPAAVAQAAQSSDRGTFDEVPQPRARAAEDAGNPLHRVVELLEEIRELTLLDEDGRRARRRAAAARRKVLALAEASNFVRYREWAKAEQVIQSLEADFPNDNEVSACRRELDAGRAAAEGEAAQQVKSRVEDMMSISSWDQAYDTAARFASDFPNNPDGSALLARVTRERDLFNESTVHRLFDEIKDNVDRRQWRRALAAAQRMLERFPGHRRAEKIRAQLATIQNNAEIEERQETENRIQELMRSKRFAEAVQLAETLLDRFPLSPQAESLEELLPKMRARAAEQEMDSSAA